MKLYDYTGTVVFDSARETGEVGTSAPFNFSAISEAAAANTGVTKTYHAISNVLGELQYVGGICVNKKIYCAPNKAQSILVYDTESERLYTIGGNFGNFKFKYTGAVYWEGYVYIVPRGVNTMLRIDPISDDVTVIDLGTNYPVTPYPPGDVNEYMNSHHYNGVISDDGFMYCPPAYSSNKLLKINMSNFEWEELNFNSSVVSTWIGCVKHPTENKIIFLSTKVFRVWDCDTDTFIDIVDGSTRPCYDMVYDPRYEAFIGFYQVNGGGHIFALKLSDWSCIDSGWINYLSTGYGVSIGPDGHYYHIEGANAFEFTFNGTIFTQQTTTTTSDSVGSNTPIHAGQAIDNNGNIYGVPASGAMTQLTFGNVVKGWPDAIVSSQYYGKY